MQKLDSKIVSQEEQRVYLGLLLLEQLSPEIIHT